MPETRVKQTARTDVVRAAQLACVLEASAEKPGNVTPSHDFDDTSFEDMLRSGIALGPELGRADERSVGETVLAAVRASRDAAGAVMREQPGGGTILNMSWDHATAGMAGENPELFSAVKGGVLSYSKSLARALAPSVRVNVLCPGWIETAFGQQADAEFRRAVAESTPLGRWGTPADVAAAALYLASPGAAFITGQAININGGLVM